MTDALSRRRFLTTAAAGAAVLLPLPTMARPAPRRALSFRNLHTNESLDVVYFAGGRYDRAALRRIDVLLRDHRTGDVMPIEPKLLDLLFDLRRRLDCDEAYHVISGYRSPRTNRALASKGNGVARKSLHMRGLAIDVRLPGCRLPALRQEAVAMRAGGVGYYAKSGFVHLDVGRVRTW